MNVDLTTDYQIHTKFSPLKNKQSARLQLNRKGNKIITKKKIYSRSIRQKLNGFK